jgi:long-chain acyl-CoA synthetase
LPAQREEREQTMASTTITPPAGRAVDAPTLSEALRRTAATHPDVVAVRTPDDRVSLSWAEVLGRVRALAGGLGRLGVGHGDTVALMLTNRPEFHLADLAAVTLGATPFSIYTTYPAEEIEYLVADAGSRVAIIEHAFLDVFTQARLHLPGLEHLIVVDGEPPPGTLALAEVEAAGPGPEPPAPRPDDVLTLIYTSGTTGPPKGVQLSHHNVMVAARAIEQMIPFPPASKVISWLPAAHIAERMAHHYIPVVYAGTITCCPEPREIVSYLPRVHPNWFFAVPRVWEKLKAGLEAMLAGQPEEQRRPLEAALSASLERVRLRQAGRPVPPELEAKVAEADAQMFSKLRAMLGLDEVRAVNAGAAPTPVEVIEFFHALGIELAELWGMSETCGAGTCNRPGQVRIGTVGPPTPGAEIRIAEDGEVLVRAEFVMLGYRNQPEKTAEALGPDGWLHTGDIGELDGAGFLRLIDRKKEIIINAAGKNMSPANIEARLKTASPLIGQAVVIGDRRPYNTALIVLDSDYAPQWAKHQGLGARGLEELAAEPRLLVAVGQGVEEANRRLARVEQIKKFRIVPGDWLPGGDELTPTMKLKRRPIAEKYASLIEEMYLE